uniref:WLM domain-containing protein n=1 Tax=viral metagenome TaxID=1070528 RepID=A0A6C0CGU0_9ZZZZ
MEVNNTAIIIISLILIFAFLIYQYHYYSNIETIVSKVDNRNYDVQIKADAQDAADLIAKVREKLILLVDHMYKTFPNDSKVKQLKKNFNPDVIKEGIDNPSYTSYTINKGQEIILCLRTNGQLVDINVLTFVCIHELSHIGNETVGHDDAFWQFFKELLTEAINIGVYTKYDYRSNPVDYCNIKITSSPMDS